MTTVVTGARKLGGRDLNINDDGVATASLIWEIWTSQVDELPAIYAAWLSWASLTGIGNSYPGSPALYIKTIGIKDNDAANRHYEVHVEYSNERTFDPNPLSEPARISFSTEFYQVPVFIDRNNQAVCMSSGEYPEGLYEDEVQLNLTFSKNVTQVPAWFLTSVGGLNISPFTVRGLSFPAEKCRLSNASASDELTRNGFIFYKLNFTISHRAKGWKTEYMDRGYWKKKAGSPTKREKIFLDDGSLPSSPVPLDGNGNVLANPNPANIVIFKKDTKLAFNFNSLPLA